MITRSQLSEIGFISKTHGISGELNVVVSGGVELEDLSCIILDIDGIYVPFFAEGIRRRGSEGYLLGLDGVESEDDAALLRGKTIYALKEEIDEGVEDEGDGLYAEDMVGFKVESEDGTLTGEVIDVDTSTENVLFIIRTDNDRRILVPVAEDFISEIDADKEIIVFDLPEGLVDL